MALINNAGGSLTSAVLLTLLAWGVRWLRAELNRKRQEDEKGRVASRRSLGRFSARLSPVALRMLVGAGTEGFAHGSCRPGAGRGTVRHCCASWAA